MKQRILAILLALTLLVMIGVVAVSATTPETKALSVEETISAAYVCPCHGTLIDEISDWVSLEGQVIENGKHYLFSESVELTMEDTTASTVLSIAPDCKALIKVAEGAEVTCPDGKRFLAMTAGTADTRSEVTICGDGKISAGGNGGGVVYMYGYNDLNICGNITLENVRADRTDNGGVIYPYNQCNVNMYGGTLTCATHLGEGGVMRLRNTSVFKMYGGTINGADLSTSSSKCGGAISIGTASSSMYMYGGTINGGTAVKGGAIYGPGSFYMTGGTITGGKTITSGTGSQGGNIYSSGTVEISGGTVSGGWAYSHGGNIYSTKNVTISGDAVIKDGTCNYTGQSTRNTNYGGGNIYFYGELLNINGGTISGGTAKHCGGNIYLRGPLNMTAGQILGGTTGYAEGESIAIRNLLSATISGGTIQGGDLNVLRDDAGTVGTITVSGAPEISNIDLTGTTTAYYIVLGDAGLSNGAMIGVTQNLDAAFTVANDKAADYAQYFFGASVRSNVVADATANTLSLVANNYCPVCKSDQTWSAWSGGAIADVTSGSHYYLTKDITSGGRVLLGTTDVVQTMCVDFNGHSIHKGLNIRNIYLRPGTTAHLMNSSSRTSELSSQMTNGSGGVIFFENNDTNGSVVHLYDGLKLYNAYEGDLTQSGSVVYLAKDCELHMHGGTIVGHDNSQSDGGVFVGGTFNMSGGKITGANAAIGGAIRVGNANAELNISGTAVIDGGTLTDTRNGGAIYVTSGTVNVTGGTINGSTVGGSGGAIYADTESSASVSISGGIVNGGEAIYGGGGAIAIRGGASLEISGTALINGGTAKLGGAVYVNDADSSFTMTGGTIQNGKTQIGANSYYGGNLYLGSGSAAAEISGGTITGGTAYANGGNIFQNHDAGELNISGNAVISNGHINYIKTIGEVTNTGHGGATNTNYGGGNLYIRGTTTISGNAQILGSAEAVTNCGGNIYVRGTLNVEGGTITGGNATYQGDCIAVRNAATAVNVSGGTVDGIAVIRSDTNDGSTITLSSAPTIGYIDVASYTTDTAYDITLGALTEGASIGIIATQDEPFTVANAELAEASKGYFHDANNALDVGVLDNCLVLGKACPHCEKFVNWVDWNGTSALNTAASDNVHYVLAATSTTGNGQTAIGAAAVKVNVIIDLNGKDLGRMATTNGVRVFAVYGGSTLSLVNTSSTESTVTGTKLNDIGGTINLSDDSNLNLYDNVKLAHAGQSEYEKIGGVVRVVNGTFTMHGGSIVADSASFGGAVAVDGTGSFIMDNGTIIGGSATRGGAVYVDNGSFVMNNGTINGGTANWGGAVCLIDSTADENATTFTMNNGIINGGTATRGAALYAQNNNPVITIVNGTVNGGIINGNDGGGTIGLGSGSGTLNLNGGVINGSQLTAEAPRGGTAICNFASSATLNMNGGTINGYEGGTTAKGGAIYSDGRVIYTAGTINGCESAAGDVMYFGTTSAELIMTLADNTEAMEAFNGKIVIMDSDDVTADAGYMVNDTDDIGTWYKDIDAAKANYVDGGYLTVLSDENITVNGHAVNVNGRSITVTGTSLCFDSSNDDYDGYAVVTMETAPVTSYAAPNGNLYITVSEGDGKYSFHRLYMQITDVNIRSSAGGLYYTATWRADDVLAGDLNATTYAPIVVGYGIGLTKGEVPLENFETQGAFTYFDNIEGFTNRFLSKTRGTEINSCVLKNIVTTGNTTEQNAANANTTINAAPFVYFEDYTGKLSCIFGDNNGAWQQGMSFKDIVDYAAGYAKTLTGDKQTAFVADLQKLYDAWFAGTGNYKLGVEFSEELYNLLNPAGV